MSSDGKSPDGEHCTRVLNSSVSLFRLRHKRACTYIHMYACRQRIYSHATAAPRPAGGHAASNHLGPACTAHLILALCVGLHRCGSATERLFEMRLLPAGRSVSQRVMCRLLQRAGVSCGGDLRMSAQASTTAWCRVLPPCKEGQVKEPPSSLVTDTPQDACQPQTDRQHQAVPHSAQFGSVLLGLAVADPDCASVQLRPIHCQCPGSSSSQ